VLSFLEKSEKQFEDWIDLFCEGVLAAKLLFNVRYVPDNFDALKYPSEAKFLCKEHERKGKQLDSPLRPFSPNITEDNTKKPRRV